jgi:hypothetical protein
MNCLTARQTLELARPDEPVRAPHDAGTIADAATHVEACPACQVAVARQEEFDRKVGGMVRNVPVPAGLKAGLLSLLEADRRLAPSGAEETGVAEDAEGTRAASAAGSTSSAVADRPVSASATVDRSRVGARRRWLGAISLSAAALILVGIGFVTFRARVTPVNPEVVAGLLARSDIGPAHLPEFTVFKNGLKAKLPATMLTKHLEFPPRKLGVEDVGVYFFTVPVKGGPALQGRLAVIPRRSVEAAGGLPAATSFLAPPGVVTYIGGFCVTTWCEGDFVYICCLSDDSGLKHLLRTHEISA